MAAAGNQVIQTESSPGLKEAILGNPRATTAEYARHSRQFPHYGDIEEAACLDQGDPGLPSAARAPFIAAECVLLEIGQCRRTPGGGPGPTLTFKIFQNLSKVQSLDRLAREIDKFISIITQSETGSKKICSMEVGRSRFWFILAPVSHSNAADHFERSRHWLIQALASLA